MIRASTQHGRDATTMQRSNTSSKLGSGGFQAAMPPLRRWQPSGWGAGGEAGRVPGARRLTLHEAIAHPRLRQRRTVRRVKEKSIGEFDIPGLPMKFSRWTDQNEIAADRLGEHNEEVLRELLSLTDQEIADLYANKVLVRDPLLDTSGSRQ